MRLHMSPQHPVDANAALALVAGPALFVALAGLAIAVHDAPVVHAAAHAAVSSH